MRVELFHLTVLLAVNRLSAHYTGLFISPRNISKIRNKWTRQRIMVVLTAIERETVDFFF